MKPTIPRLSHSVAALVILAGSLATLASCEGEIGDPPSRAPESPGEDMSSKVSHPHDSGHPVHVNWRTVDDFDKLVTASDLVVHGKVVEQRADNRKLLPWSEEKNRYLTEEEAGEEVSELARTVSTVLVSEVLRGTTEPGETVEIVELGGTLPCGCHVEPNDKPTLVPNEEAFFFLSKAGPPGRYVVVGGWQGRMSVLGGKVVHPLANDTHAGAKEFTRFEGIEISALGEAVRSVTVQ